MANSLKKIETNMHDIKLTYVNKHNLIPTYEVNQDDNYLLKLLTTLPTTCITHNVKQITETIHQTFRVQDVSLE